MAKRLVLIVGFWLLLFAPAWADEWVCYEGYQIEEENVAAEGDQPEGLDEAATSTSQIYFDITPFTNYPTYEDGFPADQYVLWASRYLNKVGLMEHYVFARTGQYQYIMAIGDIDSAFTGSATVYVLNLARSGYDYSYLVYEDSSFSLTRGQALVYSSYDGFPSLPGYDRSVDLLFLSSLVIMCGLGVWLARLVFSPLLGWR